MVRGLSTSFWKRLCCRGLSSRRGEADCSVEDAAYSPSLGWRGLGLGGTARFLPMQGCHVFSLVPNGNRRELVLKGQSSSLKQRYLVANQDEAFTPSSAEGEGGSPTIASWFLSTLPRPLKSTSP